jgi:hypothetical protein
MRSKLKASWLEHSIGKTGKLYRKYRIFYNKILRINKVFYFHKKTGVPMHPETILLFQEKVDNYLLQMDSLYFVMVYDELAPENFKKHTIASYQPIGSDEKSINMWAYASNKAKIMADRKLLQEKRNSAKQYKQTQLETKVLTKTNI